LPGNAETLLSKLEGMRGSAIIKKDGSVVASRLPGGVDQKELAKKVLGIAESSRLYADRADGSKVNHVVVSGSEGILAIGQNGDFLIVCIMGPESDSDSVASRIKKAAESLRELA
jgi:predicted regulator of Ras-like GTPase activity (Roadblock/LC7/MglB family)